MLQKNVTNLTVKTCYLDLFLLLPLGLLKFSSSFFFFNNFIYLFLAVLGLCCYTQALSSCGEQGYSSYSAQASRAGGFSRCGAQALGTQASVAAARGLQQSMVLLNQGQQLDFSQAGCPLPSHTLPMSAASGACRPGLLLRSARLIPPAAGL